MTAVLQVRDLKKRYAASHVEAVRGVSFDVESGEVLALLGPSGCGKTTTLRMIAGFEHPDAGSVQLGHRTLFDERTFVPAEERGIGFVFQDYALFPHLDVWHNVLFGLNGRDRAGRAARVRQLLSMLDLADVAHRKPQQLSGGQQQRVALARSMAPAPQVLLLDEPFSNLDARLRQSARSQVRALLKEQGMSAILVTHDQEEALEFADRVGVMRAGRIEQLDTPEAVYQRPRTAYVANFIGMANVMRAVADGTRATSPIGIVELDRPAEGSIDVLLRPESLTLEAAAPGVDARATIASRRFFGARTVYRVALGETLELLVEVPGPGRFGVGDSVTVAPRAPGSVLSNEASEHPAQPDAP